MSVGVISWLTDVYDADTMTETAVRANLVCDTVADLPAPTYVTGFRLIIGSKAYVISDSSEYMLDGSGNWILQRSADISAIISQISQIEDDLQDVTADASYARSQIDDFIRPALISLIDRGSKNALDLSAAQSGTDAGVTFTVNQDSSITCIGTATATAWLHVPVTIHAGRYNFTGMPEDGSSTTYRIDFRPTPTGTPVLVGDTEAPKVWTLSAAWTGYFNIRVASGYSFGSGATVFPMLSQPAQYEITDQYVPFSPTNRQLYEMIKSYHP